MSMNLLKSAVLVIGPMCVLVVFGLIAFLAIWIAVIGLFLLSRLTKGATFFAEWSWSQFLLTIGLGVAIPYVLLLMSSGF